jgi:hypothetical protein
MHYQAAAPPAPLATRRVRRRTYEDRMNRDATLSTGSGTDMLSTNTTASSCFAATAVVQAVTVEVAP